MTFNLTLPRVIKAATLTAFAITLTPIAHVNRQPSPRPAATITVTAHPASAEIPMPNPNSPKRPTLL